MKIVLRLFFVVTILAAVVMIFLSGIFGKSNEKNIVFKSDADYGFIDEIKFLFPKGEARFLEFEKNNEPGSVLGKTKEELNSGNRIRSFAMLASREDISSVDGKSCVLDRTQGFVAPIYIGVGAGSLYAGDNFASVMADSSSHRLDHVYELEKIEKFGMEHYIPIDIDPVARKKNPHPNFNDVDVYLHRNHKGIADLYIECRNKNHETGPCRMMFSMSPDLRATLNVSIQRFDLPHAACIRKYSSDLIMKFQT